MNVVLSDGSVGPAPDDGSYWAVPELPSQILMRDSLLKLMDSFVAEQTATQVVRPEGLTTNPARPFSLIGRLYTPYTYEPSIIGNSRLMMHDPEVERVTRGNRVLAGTKTRCAVLTPNPACKCDSCILAYKWVGKVKFIAVQPEEVMACPSCGNNTNDPECWNCGYIIGCKGLSRLSDTRFVYKYGRNTWYIRQVPKHEASEELQAEMDKPYFYQCETDDVIRAVSLTLMIERIHDI